MIEIQGVGAAFLVGDLAHRVTLLISVNHTPETMSLPRHKAKMTVKFSAGVSVWLTTSIHPTICTIYCPACVREKKTETNKEREAN